MNGRRRRGRSRPRARPDDHDERDHSSAAGARWAARRDLSKQAECYTARWGLEPIDDQGQEIFLRADGPDHHVLTLHAGHDAGLDHSAFEVADPDDIERAADILAYTTEVEQITNDDYVPPLRPLIRDQWGSLPPDLID